MMKRFVNIFCVVLVIAAFGSCKSGSPEIKEIHIGLHQHNELKIQVDVSTSDTASLYIEYWPDSNGGTNFLLLHFSFANRTQFCFVQCASKNKLSFSCGQVVFRWFKNNQQGLRFSNAHAAGVADRPV